MIFLPRTLLGRPTAAIQDSGSGVPPPQEQCPLQDKFLTAAAYGYDYIVACFIKLIVRYRVVSPVSRFTARFISIRKGPPPVLRSFYE